VVIRPCLDLLPPGAPTWQPAHPHRWEHRAVRQGSRREANKARVRAALHDAAVELFLERGYDATTISDISDRAQTSPRTFFNYFSSKEEIIFATHQGWSTEVAAAIAARPEEETALVAIKRGFVDAANAHEAAREMVMMRNRVIASTPSLRGRAAVNQREWEDRVSGALAERGHRERPSRLDELLGAVTVAVLAVSMREWLAGNGKPDLPKLVERNLGDLADEVCT